MKIAMYDKDTYYLERVCKIITEDNKEGYELVPVTDEQLKALNNSQYKMVIMPLGSDITINNIPVMYLCENKSEEKEGVFCKYSLADEFISNIKIIYSKFEMYDFGDAECKADNIITFISTGGGMGATSMAMGAAQRFAKSDNKVLYIDLKPLQPTGYYYISEDIVTINSVCDDIKIKAGKLDDIINNIYKNDKGVYVLKGFEHVKEIYNMSADDIKKVLASIVKKGSFDKIIINLSMNYNEILEAVIGCSRLICIPVYGSEYYYKRLAYAVNNIEEICKGASNKIKVIYNKFKTIPEIHPQLDNRVAGGIEYIEAEKNEDVIEKISGKMFFDNMLKSM